MATRIALYEAGAKAEYAEVDPKTKHTEDGIDFTSINGLGLVPVIQTDEGDILTENAAILQYVAGRFPEAELAPADARGRSRLQQWLSFIGTELHKAVYLPLLDKTAAPEVKAYALAKAAPRLEWLASNLDGREYLLDRFSVADAYLTTVLNWSAVTPIELQKWPALFAYFGRTRRRPAVARAIAEEKVLYARELRRHGELSPAVARVLGVDAAAQVSGGNNTVHSHRSDIRR